MNYKELCHMILFLETEIKRYENNTDKTFKLHKEAVRKSVKNFKRLKRIRETTGDLNKDI